MSSTLKTISVCTYSNCGMIHVSPEFLKDDAQTLLSTWIERIVHCVFDDKDTYTKALTANIKGRILQGRGAKYYLGNITSVVFFDDIWPSGMHITWPFVMPSRGLCRQSSYARMLDFDPTLLSSMWTRADISGKLCRNKFMSDHCSGIAMWTRPQCLAFGNLERTINWPSFEMSAR